MGTFWRYRSEIGLSPAPAQSAAAAGPRADAAHSAGDARPRRRYLRSMVVQARIFGLGRRFTSSALPPTP